MRDTTGTVPDASAWRIEPGGGPRAARGQADHVGARDQLGGGAARCGPVSVDTVAQRRGDARTAAASPASSQIAASQSWPGSSRAAPARRAASRRAPRRAQNAMRAGPSPRRGGARPAPFGRVGPRLDQRVGPREVAAAGARWSRASCAVRASRRPKKISTSGRATCVERIRSVGSWKLPTFSECEWRSAIDAALGAYGSWTWTMSNSADERSVSSVWERSSGTGAARGRGPRGSGSPWPSASTGGPALAGAPPAPRRHLATSPVPAPGGSAAATRGSPPASPTARRSAPRARDRPAPPTPARRIRSARRMPPTCGADLGDPQGLGGHRAEDSCAPCGAAKLAARLRSWTG